MRACLDCARPTPKTRCTECARRNRKRRKTQGLTGERGSTHASRKRRANVLAQSKDCFYCGEPADIADHFVPLAKGGKDIEENLVAACASCNQRKADKMPREFLREMRGTKRAGHITVVVGLPGTGKTTITRLLADHLHQPFGN